MRRNGLQLSINFQFREDKRRHFFMKLVLLSLRKINVSIDFVYKPEPGSALETEMEITNMLWKIDELHSYWEDWK